MVRYRIIFILSFLLCISGLYSQTPTFPRFRLIQLQQSDTLGQFIVSDTAKNAIWSSALRVQDSILYIFGSPYVVDSTRLNTTKDTLIYYQNGNVVGFSEIDGSPTNELQTISLSNDTIFLSDGGFIIIPEEYKNTDTSGYNTALTLSDSIITIVDGQSSISLDIKQLYDNTDTSGYNNQLFFSNNILYIADNNSELQVDLSSLATEDNVGYNKAFYITNDTLYITDDSTTQFVDLLPYLDNTDSSGFNRDLYVSNDTLYIQDDLTLLSVQLPIISPAFNRELYIQGDSLFLRDDSTTLFVNLQPYINTDNQQLTKNEDTIFLDNSNYVILQDDSPTNEIQFLSISNDTIYLTDGGFIKLPADTDEQNLSVQRSEDSTTISISIERGNTISFEDKVYDGDSSSTNELQLLGFSNDTLYISNGNDIYLGGYINTDTSGFNRSLTYINNILSITDDDTTLQVTILSNDNQQLSKDLDTIFLERGGYILLSDDNPTNEIQFLSIENDTLFISNGNEVSLLPYINTDTSGYNRAFTFIDSTLSITDDLGTLQVTIPQPVFIDTNTDEQQLSISNDTIYLTNSTPVVLSDNDPTNELQDIFLSANKDTLYITNGSGVRLNIDSTRLNITGDSLIYYYNDSIIRIDPLNLLLDVVSGCIGGLTTSTDVYALFDMSGSVDTNNVITIATVLNNWFTAYQANNPAYTGNLYVLPVQGINPTERYLDYLRIIRSNELNVDTSNPSINPLIKYTPWLDPAINAPFVKPDEMLLLAFVNETNPSYHHIPDSFLIIEPTATYQSDLFNFELEYDSMQFFKGIIYPIHQGGFSDGFILHALGALDGNTQTTEQIQEAFGDNYRPLVFDVITTANPYNTLTPLKDLGWSGVLSKSAPASLSFTDSSFNAEINSILNPLDINYVSVIQDYSNNILTLRSIGSSTLDITVDSSGCIRIELQDTIARPILYTDTTTIVGDGTQTAPFEIAPSLFEEIRRTIDTIPFLPPYVDSTRLNPKGDTLLYYQDGILIGSGAINKGNGIFQNLFDGNGQDSIIQLCDVNNDEYIPNDKEDILVYRNGLFIDNEYILQLDPSTCSIELAFVPEQGDRIMAVWYTGNVEIGISPGLDSVFTDMYLTGNGTLINPLSIDTMYVASKEYVDNSIAAAGGGDITGVNETPQYGLLGGSASGEVTLIVDTTVIAYKEWTSNNFSQLDSIIGGYGILGQGDSGNVILNIDSTIIATKDYINSQNYLTSNDSITLQGDIQTIKGTTLFNVVVDTATNIRGGQVGDLLYQSTNTGTTSKLNLPSISQSGNYVLSNGLLSPYWESISNITVGSTLRLDTARTINGVSFDGTANITITSNTTNSLSPGSYILGNAFNGSSNQTWSINALSTNDANTLVARDGSGNFSANVITASLTGNASTATTLQTARLINGTSFNGSQDITTANWGTARNITIGSTTRSVNGSTNYSWTLSDIGAAATNQIFFIGTTQFNINRTSAAQTLTGINIDGQANRVTNNLTPGNFMTGSAYNGSNAQTFNVDTITIAHKDWVTANFTNSNLIAGYGINGLNYNGSSSVTWTTDTTLIAAKTWVNTQLIPKIERVISSNLLLGQGIIGDTLTIDTSIIASKDFVNNSIAQSGDITSVNATPQYGIIGGSSSGDVLLKVDSSIIAAKEWVQNNFVIGNQNITLAGDISGTGTTNATVNTTLATISGLTAGTYNNSATQVRPFTIDVKGRITAIGTAVTITPAFSSITSTPTTLSGYGITDAYTITKVNDTLSYYQKTITNPVTGTGTTNELTYFVSSSQIGSLSTTTYPNLNEISYVKGVTSSIQTQLNNKQPLSAKLTSLAGLSYSSGTPFVKMTGANTFSLDNTTYLTANQTITLSGDISGSGTTSISTALSNTGVVAGTYKSVTVDVKGRVTAGTNPTTLVGYGITDALSNSTTSTQDGYFGDIYLRDDSSPSHYLKITNTDNLTANRTLSLLLNNADRTISMQGNLTVTAFANVSGTNTGDQTITLTGDVTGSGTSSFATTLANTGVVANTYSYPTLTVDSKGRITNISSNAIVTPDSLSTPNTTVLRNPTAGINVNNVKANSLTINNYTGEIGNQSMAVFYNGAINLVDADVSSITNNPIINAVETSILNDGNTTTEYSASELFFTVGDPDGFNDNSYFRGRYMPLITMKGLNFTRNTNQRGLIKFFAAGNPNPSTYNGHDGAIVFNTRETDRIAISANGNLGIGIIPASTSTALTSDITHKLQVKSSSYAEGYFRIVNSDNGLEVFNVKAIDNGNRAIIGIQESNPLVNLHIGGTSTSGVSGLSVAILNTANNGVGRYMYYNTNNPNVKIAYGAGWQDASRFAIFTKNTASDFVNTDERFTIISSGEVGINNTTPTYRLHVKETNTSNLQDIDDGAVRRVASFIGANDIGLQIGNNVIYNTNIYGTANTSGNVSISFATATTSVPTTKMVILGNGNVGINTFAPTEKLYVSGNIYATGTIVQNSDIRYKTNIRPIEPTYDKVKLLNVVRYIMNDKEDLGLIAQEVELIYPELVTTYEDGNKALSYIKLVPLLVKALQEQEDRLSKLEQLVKDILDDK